MLKRFMAMALILAFVLLCSLPACLALADVKQMAEYSVDPFTGTHFCPYQI